MQNLPFVTATQWVALLLTLIAGWCFGYASSSSGRRWRERYLDAERDREQRIRELEEENTRLRHELDRAVPVRRVDEV